jgi:hypothetical protein
MRISKIQKLVDIHRPRCVVMYGSAHTKQWSQIGGVSLLETHIGGVLAGKRGVSTMLVVRHPVARGETINAYYESVGRDLIAGFPSTR